MSEANVAQLPAKAQHQTPPIVAGGAVKAIVPQSMDDAYRLAKAVCMSGLAPRGLEKPEAAMVAIMHGLEIGLTPMMALQKIAVINGRPTLWGDGALGLVRGSGLCKYVKESITGKDDARVAVCETLRAGEPEPIVRQFSVTDAKKAGLWGKSGPWQQFPERMLQMRARAFALRDGYADVLGGMYLAEELQGTEPSQNGRATIVGARASAPPPTSARIAPPPPPPAPEPAQVVTDALPGDWQDYLDKHLGELREAKDANAANQVHDAVHDSIGGAQDRGEITKTESETIREAWERMSAAT